MVEAGGGFLKYSRRTWWIFSKCSMLRTYTSTRQMSSIVPPAASTALFRFSHTCFVCASMSPMPAMVPSGRREVIPERNTSLPFASIAIACEKCPEGSRILSVRICCFFIVLLSNERHADLGCAFLQLCNDFGSHRAFNAILRPARALQVARREDLAAAWCALRLSNFVRKTVHAPLEIVDAELLRIYGHEEMRTGIGLGRIAVEHPDLVPDRAAREAAAQEIDRGGQAETLGAGCRQEHALDGLCRVGRRLPGFVRSPT